MDFPVPAAIATYPSFPMETTMNNVRKPLTGLIVLGAMLAMPMAFAQAQDAATPQTTPPTDQAQTAPTAEPKQVTWADLDGDKDGKLTKAEVATVPTLTQIFDQADANHDGALTAEEYKAFAATNNGTGNSSSGADSSGTP
jgi:hypothetical protein